MNYPLFILGGLVCAGVIFYGYTKASSKKKKVAPQKQDSSISDEIEKFLANVEIENVEKLKLADIVSYFKSLSLKQGEDTPFIAKFQKNGKEVIIFATHSESTDTIDNFKAICAANTDDELKKILQDDNLVVLS